MPKRSAAVAGMFQFASPRKYTRAAKSARRANTGRSAARSARANYRTGGWMQMEEKFVDYIREVGASPATGDFIQTDIVGSLSNPTGKIADNGTVTNYADIVLNAVTAGSGPQQRDGRTIKMMSAEIRGFVNWFPVDAVAMQPNSGAIVDSVSIYLVLDKQANGALLDPENVLLRATILAGAVDTVSLAFDNLEYRSRFKILKRLVIQRPNSGYGNSTGSSITEQPQALVPFEIKHSFGKSGLTVTYSDTEPDASVSQMVDNALHVIAIKSGGDPAGGEGFSRAVLSYLSRVRFYP